MLSARKLILAGIATYAFLAGLMLLYSYVWQPGHGAITRLLPVLLLMAATMLVIMIGTGIGTYHLVTLPSVRTRGNVAVVAVGLVVVGGWLMLSFLG